MVRWLKRIIEVADRSANDTVDSDDGVLLQLRATQNLAPLTVQTELLGKLGLLASSLSDSVTISMADDGVRVVFNADELTMHVFVGQELHAPSRRVGDTTYYFVPLTIRIVSNAILAGRILIEALGTCVEHEAAENQETVDPQAIAAALSNAVDRLIDSFFSPMFSAYFSMLSETHPCRTQEFQIGGIDWIAYYLEDHSSEVVRSADERNPFAYKSFIQQTRYAKKLAKEKLNVLRVTNTEAELGKNETFQAYLNDEYPTAIISQAEGNEFDTRHWRDSAIPVCVPSLAVIRRVSV